MLRHLVCPAPNPLWDPLMFGLGTTELVILLVVAILYFGSKYLPPTHSPL